MEIVNRLMRDEQIAAYLMWEKSITDITYYHSVRTAMLVEQMLEFVPKHREIAEDILRGALLHDIGKADLMQEILESEKPMTADIKAYVQTHSLLGFLKIVEDYDVVPTSIVLLHHEKLDGSGYPSGIRNIPEYVQLVTVADMYEALTSERCYKREYTHEESMRILRKDVRKGRLNEEYVELINRISENR